MENKKRYFGAKYALLSGILLFLATPFVGVWVLASIALIPLFLHFFSLSKYTLQNVAVATLAMGLPYCLAQGEPLFRLAGSWWVTPTGELSLFGTGVYFGGICAIIIFAALFYIIPLLVVVRMHRNLIPKALLLGLLFACVEFIRSSIFLAGYSWGTMGYLLIDTMYVKHVASIVGVHGLTFLLVAWSAWSAQLILRYLEEEGSMMIRLRRVFFGDKYFYESITMSSFFIAVLLFGAYQESRPISTQLGMRVAVIASNIRTEESISEGSYRTYRALLLQALQSEPDIILTPENIFPYFMINEDGYGLVTSQIVYLPNAVELYADFLALSESHPRTTFALATHTMRSGVQYNSILLYRGGVVESVYHKRKPVPFTEYVPLGLPLRIYQTIGRGADVQDFRMGDIKLAGYVCSEIGITPLSAHGASLILSPSNDSALVSTTILPLHHQFARMRALEAGAYMLRSSKGGISSIIDPKGRAIRTMRGQNGVLIADIP